MFSGLPFVALAQKGALAEEGYPLTLAAQFLSLILTVLYSNSNLLIINMSKDILQILFDSRARVKILKLLFRNDGQAFNAREIADRVQEEPRLVRQEIKKFLAIGLLKISKNGR